MKYKPGTKLKNLIVFEVEHGKEKLPVGTIITLKDSIQYPNHYDFKGYPEAGWNVDFIETPENFKLAKITNWREELDT